MFIDVGLRGNKQRIIPYKSSNGEICYAIANRNTLLETKTISQMAVSLIDYDTVRFIFESRQEKNEFLIDLKSEITKTEEELKLMEKVRDILTEKEQLRITIGEN